MKAECIDRVSDALGRRTSAVENRDIENRMRLARKRLATQDPDGWQKLSADEQAQRAGAEAARELTQEALTKRIRTAQTILAHDRIENYVASQLASGADANRISALSRMLEGRADGKNNIESVWSKQMGILSAASTYLTKTWHAAGGRLLHLMADPKAEVAMIRALYGDETVPKAFRDAARDFHTIADRLRRRFNAAGGDIGKLDNWGIPQSWSAMKVLKAGKEAWTDAMLPLLDRSKYVHEDGARYSDEDLRGLLDEAWQTIATQGANKVLGGTRVGGGIKANRMSAERQIHLKDADAQLQARQQFSDRGVLDTMLGHVRSMARNIALVEQFGPNADLAFRQALDDATNREVMNDPAKAWWYTRQGRFLARVYNYMAGNDHMLPSTWYGRAIQGWRNLNLMKLSATVINSLGDWGTMLNTAHVNGVPKTKMWLNELRAMNPLDRSQRRIAESAGLMVREYSQMISRFGADIGAHGWTSKLGNTVLKLTLAPYAWRARQQAFSLGMMDQVGRAVAENAHITDLARGDQQLIKQSGITDDHWQILRLAQPDDWGGNHALITPESIYRIPDEAVAKITDEPPALAKDRAASALMGLVYAEQDRAILEPGARVKVMLGADQDPDSVLGILGRSFSLFKTYSFDLTLQHLTRALKYYDNWKGSVGYLASLIATTTLLGATANAINDIINGKDPRSLNLSAKDGWKNWVSALVRGGGLGLYGDYLINTAGSRGNTLGETILGPLVSDASSIMDLIQKSIAAGTDPDADAERKLHSPALEAERTVRSYTPGANLWYTRAVLDHLIFNELSDYLSPGYLMRQKARAQQQNQSMYWNPDEATPHRAPDLSHMTASQN